MAFNQLGFMQLFILMGFGCFYASYLLEFFGFFLIYPVDTLFAIGHSGQAVFYIAIILASTGLLFFLRRNREQLKLHRPSITIVCLFGASCLPAYTIVSSALSVNLLPVFYSCCFVSGGCLAVFFTLWEDVFQRGRLSQGRFNHAVTYTAGGAVFLLAMLLLPSASIAIVAEIFLCLSFGMLFFVEPRCEPSHDTSVDDAVAFFKRQWHITVLSIVVNVTFGLAFIELYLIGGYGLLGAMGIALVVDFSIAIINGRQQKIPFIGMLRVVGLIISLCFITAAFNYGVAAMIALCLAVGCWLSFRTVNSDALAIVSRQHSFSTLYASSKGKLSSNIGFAIGIATGAIMTAFLPAESAMSMASVDVNGSSLAMVQTINIVVACLLIVALLVLLPFKLDSEESGIGGLRIEPSQKEEEAAPREQTIEDKCAYLIDHYKLTGREAEVFVYVVRGRNAKYVAQQLFITESTAKTHIANIYRKLNVHSQQALLDLVERL